MNPRKKVTANDLKESPKWIVIWGREGLLSKSIQILLAAKPLWKVVCIAGQTELEAFIPTAEAAREEVVIIDQAQNYNPVSLPLEFLRRHPDVKVVEVNTMNNSMAVNQWKKFEITQVSDLFAIIESEP